VCVYVRIVHVYNVYRLRAKRSEAIWCGSSPAAGINLHFGICIFSVGDFDYQICRQPRIHYLHYNICILVVVVCLLSRSGITFFIRLQIFYMIRFLEAHVYRYIRYLNRKKKNNLAADDLA